jgi:5'-nucleotidase
VTIDVDDSSQLMRNSKSGTLEAGKYNGHYRRIQVVPRWAHCQRPTADLTELNGVNRMNEPSSARNKRLLLTNDDGIHAPGLKALEDALVTLGEVMVVAPEREMSGASQSLTLHSPLRIEQYDQRHFSVSGTPADAVILAFNRLLPEPPDLVVSGINPGGNMGENVVYSGTVAAAMEATLHGVPAIAMSLASRQALDFRVAASFAREIAARVLAEGLPPNVMLNVNVPRGEVRGVRLTRQSQKVSRNIIHEQHDPRGRPYYWQDESMDAGKVEPESDYAAVLSQNISITPLQANRTDDASRVLLTGWLSYLAMSVEPPKPEK